MSHVTTKKDVLQKEKKKRKKKKKGIEKETNLSVFLVSLMYSSLSYHHLLNGTATKCTPLIPRKL